MTTSKPRPRRRVRPIKPIEVISKPVKRPPDEVLKALNRLIHENWDAAAGWSEVREADLARDISTAMSISVGDVYARRLLDVVREYEAAGWVVIRDERFVVCVKTPFFVFRPLVKWL